MAVRIELDRQALGAVSEAVKRAAEGAMKDLHSDVIEAQVMPLETGHMQDNQTYTEIIQLKDGPSVRLVTDAPQARRLYYHPEYHFQKKNQNAGGLWLEPWISGSKKDFLLDAYAELLRREL